MKLYLIRPRCTNPNTPDAFIALAHSQKEAEELCNFKSWSIERVNYEVTMLSCLQITEEDKPMLLFSGWECPF